MEKHILEKSLNSIWDRRFIDSENAAKELLVLIETARKSNEHYFEMTAKLYHAAISFLLSKELLLEELTKCIEFFTQYPTKKELVIAYNYTGNVYENVGDYNKAIYYCQQGYKFATRQNYTEGIGDTSNTLGMIYMRLGDFEKAGTFFHKALETRVKHDLLPAAASSYNMLGRLHTLKKDYSSALNYYQQSLDIRIKLKQDGAIPWSLMGIASLYLEKGNLDDSHKKFEHAIRLAEKNKDKRCLMHCYLGTGRLHMLESKSTSAKTFLNMALEIAKSINAKSIISEVYHALAEVCTQEHDFESALKFFRNYHSIKEEILNNETHNKLKSQEIAFAVERSQKEAEIYQLKHVELKKAYDKLEEKNKEITDSIQYASSIQSALLPDLEILNKYFSDAFILFKPRDIVSGDFYWIQPLENKLFITTADCTGHGVPGAFMSVLGISLLDDIVNKNKIEKPDEILYELRSKIIHALNQHKTEQKKDGMDMALCLFDFDAKKLFYSGAYNGLYRIRNKELIEIKADRMPIGLHQKDKNKFQLHELDIMKNDIYYMFSDGYADQFGGEKGKKLKTTQFKEILLEHCSLPLESQKKRLDKYFEKWRGTIEQIDDVIVTGLKI